jgi:quercetin dioxygenase-like cupin family protein
MKFFPDLIDTLPPYQGRFNARELACEKARVLFASYPAGTAIPAHTHDTENVGVVTQGTLELIVDGTSSLYNCGDWYHLLPGQEHSAFFAEDTAIIEFWFSASE